MKDLAGGEGGAVVEGLQVVGRGVWREVEEMAEGSEDEEDDDDAECGSHTCVDACRCVGAVEVEQCEQDGEEDSPGHVGDAR